MLPLTMNGIQFEKGGHKMQYRVDRQSLLLNPPPSQKLAWQRNNTIGRGFSL